MKTPVLKVPRCLAALAGLILVVALVVLVVALPWLRQNQFYQDAIDTRSGQLERFRRSSPVAEMWKLSSRP